MYVLDFYYRSPTILVLRSVPFICAALQITSYLVSYDFPGSGILEGFGFVFLSKSLSSVCSHIGMSRYTGGNGKGEKGYRATVVARHFSLFM